MPTFNAWQRLQTQWRIDANGRATGLDYGSAISFLVQVLRIKPKPLADMVSGLQAMELAVQEVWREQRD